MNEDVEVLVVTMNQIDNNLYNKMNLKTDAIISNQTNYVSRLDSKIRNKNVKFLCFNERGVGLNRNNALMRSTADYCIFADDDMVFYDDYEEKVKKWFKLLPKADFLIFNLDEKNVTNRRKNNKVKRINILNYSNYGAARFVIRRNSISMKSIYFNLNFGGGTTYSAGEDVLFVRDCLRKKCKIYAVPDTLASLNDERDSSWFKGYNEKYFFDKGVFLKIAHPKLCSLFALYLVIKHKEYRSERNSNIRKIYRLIKKGIRSVK